MTSTAVRLLRLAHKLESVSIALRSNDVDWARHLLAEAQADLGLAVKQMHTQGER